MRLETTDTNFLWRALELAGRGEGHTRPNPPVGAVIVKNGKIVGEGWHKRCGGDHAEVAAIKDAIGKRRVRSLTSGEGAASPLCGATIYVTLEPCSKPGRVGACTDAIIAAGIKRVVYAVPEPNPKNRGRAKRVLAKHGVECVKVCKAVCDPVEWDGCGGMRSLVEESLRTIAPFAKHVTTGIPYVTVKLAMSLDGRICDDRGESKWISNADSRKIAGWERARVDAIMVGAETVRKDNPSLLSHNKRNDDLVRVVVSRSGKLPKNARIFTDGAPNKTWVFRVGKDVKDLEDVLRQLGKAGVMHVFCEGGLNLARSLAEAGLVDRWMTFVAPIVIGSRPLKDALRLHKYLYGMNDDDMEAHYEVGDCRRAAERTRC